MANPIIKAQGISKVYTLGQSDITQGNFRNPYDVP